MARRQSRANTTAQNSLKKLALLLQAGAALDDWMVWMEDAVRTHHNLADRARRLDFIRWRPLLSSVGSCFGPDGDDGAMEAAASYLIEVERSIRQTVDEWRCELTGAVTRAVSVELMCWTPSEAPQTLSFYDWLTHDIPSSPTAHEAALVWLRRLTRLLALARTSPRSESEGAELPSNSSGQRVFEQLTWNTDAALQLLTEMEQERAGCTYIFTKRRITAGVRFPNMKSCGRDSRGPPKNT